MSHIFDSGAVLLGLLGGGTGGGSTSRGIGVDDRHVDGDDTRRERDSEIGSLAGIVGVLVKTGFSYE